MTTCANVWEADDWNNFVCSRHEGHSGLHHEVILSDLPNPPEYDQESATMAIWSDSPEKPVWRTLSTRETIVSDSTIASRFETVETIMSLLS